MQVFTLTVLICSGYVHAGGYGGPVGLVSSVGSSSQYNAGLGARSISNAGTLSSGGNGVYSSNTNTDSGYDDGSETSGVAINSAGISSGGNQYSNGAVVAAGAGPGNIAVNLPAGPGADNGVQFLNINTNNGLNNIGPQIQYTIQNILRKFGIDMQQNMMRSSSFQPGQTYVFQTNGAPLDQSQYQYMGSGGMSGFQSQNGGSQYQSQSGQPVSIAYKVISQPTAAVAFQVSGPGQGASSASFGSGSQSGFGANTISGARSSSFSVPMGSGAQGVVSYTGAQPKVIVYNANNQDDSSDSGDDSGSDSQAASVTGISGYSAPARVVVPPPAPVYQAPAPVYQPPAPVYKAPAPVYKAAAPVYKAPTPVYVAPAPAYVPPPPPAPTYGAPPPAPYGGAAQRSKVKYAASNNQRSESNSNVAYEAENES